MALEIGGIDYDCNDRQSDEKILDKILSEKYDFDGFGAILAPIENEVKSKVPKSLKKQKYSTPNTPLD